MKKRFLSVCVSFLTLALLGCSSLFAADYKPVAVVSVASCDSIDQSIARVLEAAGFEEIHSVLTMSLDGIDGFDKTKPSGFVLLSDGKEFVPFFFLPIANADDFTCPAAEALKARFHYNSENRTINFADPEEDEDGNELPLPEGTEFKLIEKNGWLFAAPAKYEASVPVDSDPLSFLNGIDSKHLVGGTITISAIPAELIDTLSAPLRVEAAKDEKAARQIDTLVKTFDYVKSNYESIEWGISVDAAKGNISLMTSALSVPGSTAEKAIKATSKTKSVWTDLYRPEDAVLTGLLFGQQDAALLALQKENISASVDAFLAKLDESISFEENEEKEKACFEEFKTLVAGWRDWAAAETNSANEDSAFSILEDGSLIFASEVSDGKAMSDMLSRSVDLIKKSLCGDEETDPQISKFAANIKTKENAFKDYSVTTFVIPKSFVDKGLPGLAVRPGYAFLIGINGNSVIVVAGPDQKKVSASFKEIADKKREPADAQQKWIFSVPNLAKFLLHIDTIKANQSLSVIFETAAAGDNNAAIVGETSFTENSVSGNVTINGDLFKLFNDIFEKVKAESEKDSEDDAQLDTDAEDLF